MPPPLALALAMGLRGPLVKLLVSMGLSQGGNMIVLGGMPPAEVVGLPPGPAMLAWLRRQNGRPRIAVEHQFSSHNLLLRYWLALTGVDPGRDIEIVVVPPQQVVSALSCGQIAGIQDATLTRVSTLLDGAVEAALFLARDPAGLPPEAALTPILGAPVPDSARARLLAGKLYDKAAAEGPRVCACFGVTRDAVRHAVVTHRLRTTAEIGVVLGAGTNCGSCVPELQEILRDVSAPAA